MLRPEPPGPAVSAALLLPCLRPGAPDLYVLPAPTTPLTDDEHDDETGAA